jgi:hypothetical protein
MACSVCGAEDCADPMHTLPRELFQKIILLAPINAAVPAVARRWREAFSRNRFIRVPEGTLQAQWHPVLRRLWCPFEVTALFMPKVGQPKNRGEYRQYVRGYFRRNGVEVAHPLPFNKVLSNEFQLDGPADSVGYYGQRKSGLGRCNAYGVELKNITRSPHYNGAYFYCSDTPYITGATGDVIEMHLEFKGCLVDLDNPDAAEARFWTIEGRITVPAEEKKSPALAKK